jgi:hypothetical protein
MVARSEGFQNWELAPLATLVFAPASPAELAPTSNPRKSPALVPTATSAYAGGTVRYNEAAVSTQARRVEMGPSVRHLGAYWFFRIG